MYCTAKGEGGINLAELCRHKELDTKVSTTSKGNQSTVALSICKWIMSALTNQSQTNWRRSSKYNRKLWKVFAKQLRLCSLQCNIHPSIPHLLYIVYIYSDLCCWPRPMSKLSHPSPTRITERQAGKVKSAQKADKVFIPYAAKNTLQCMKCTLNQQIPSECSKIYDIRIHISYFRGCSHPPHSSALATR